MFSNRGQDGAGRNARIWWKWYGVRSFFMELCARFARFYSVMQIAPECSRFEWYKKVQTYPVQKTRFKCKIALIINIDYIPIILLFYLLLPIVALEQQQNKFYSNPAGLKYIYRLVYSQLFCLLILSLERHKHSFSPKSSRVRQADGVCLSVYTCRFGLSLSI